MMLNLPYHTLSYLIILYLTFVCSNLQNAKKIMPKTCNLGPARSWIPFFYLTKAQFGSNGPKRPQHHSKIFKNHRKTMTFFYLTKAQFGSHGPKKPQHHSILFKNLQKSSKRKDVCWCLTNIFWFESPKYEEHGAQKYHKISYWITFEIFYTITAYLR